MLHACPWLLPFQTKVYRGRPSRLFGLPAIRPRHGTHAGHVPLLPGACVAAPRGLRANGKQNHRKWDELRKGNRTETT